MKQGKKPKNGKDQVIIHVSDDVIDLEELEAHKLRKSSYSINTEELKKLLGSPPSKSARKDS